MKNITAKIRVVTADAVAALFVCGTILVLKNDIEKNIVAE